eukprot:TRINITY_DN7360_c0_g4_i3.p1 TRINITY_DN7360_c0_g4~~TRINITY_DN7360_c0_g4_i3.p1  ORF type:complete len:153 (+),score=19.53 TRINITY_DN7360_c0_g4_i3:55-513(+)
MAAQIPLSENPPRWTVIYPVYIDKTKKISEGRRIKKESCPENPGLIEIAECCRSLELGVAIEPEKAYSRDFFLRGRVRVLWKHDDGTPMRDDIKSKEELLEKICEMIRTNPNRRVQPNRDEAAFVAAATPAAAPQATKAAPAAAKKGKKGKK